MSATIAGSPTHVGAPSASFRRIEELREAIAARAPRDDAARRVRVSAPLSRTCYWSLMRLSGAPSDVLDYAAYLFASDRAAPHPGRGPLELEAVEHEDDALLTLLLSRALYDGE